MKSGKMINNICHALIFKNVLQCFERLFEKSQIDILNTAHRLLLNELVHLTHRIQFLKHYLLLLQHARNTNILFFRNVFSDVEVEDVLCTNVGSDAQPEEQLFKNIVYLNTFDIMFGTLKRSVMEGKQIFPAAKQNAFLCKLLSRCYDIRKEKPVNISNAELWHLYQCTSFNCLITLCQISAFSHNNEDYEIYNFFLFKEKKDKIWENLINKKTEIIFPTYIDLIPEKKYYTWPKDDYNLEITLVSSDMSDMTLLSKNQECQKYDFVKYCTSVKTKEKLSSDRCYFVDNLNENQCMPTLCTLISEKLGKMPRPKQNEMPEWMKSFNNSLRNPQLDIYAGTYILMVILKTNEVFHPFAKDWMGPILFAIINGSCGSGINDFVYKVVKMLLDWHDIAVPDENNYEGKYVATIVSLIASNIIGKNKNEAIRNFHLLSLTIQRWNICLKSLFEVPNFLLMLNDSTELKYGIGVICLYLKHGLNPNTIEDRKKFFSNAEILFNNFQQPVYMKASKMIGLFLRNMVNDGSNELEMKNYHYTVKKLLIAFSNQDKSAFILRLKKLVKHYSLLLDEDIIKCVANIWLVITLKPLHQSIVESLVQITFNPDLQFQQALTDVGITKDIFREKILDKRWSYDKNLLSQLLQDVWSYEESLQKKAFSIFIGAFSQPTSSMLDIFIFILENLNKVTVADLRTTSIILELLFESSTTSAVCNNELYLKDVFECDYKVYNPQNTCVTYKHSSKEESILIRSYRFGDFIPTELSFVTVAKILQNLGKMDSTCAAHILVSLVNELLQQIQEARSGKEERLATMIVRILNHETMKNEYLNYSLMNIANICEQINSISNT